LQENLYSPAEALERFREISGCAELEEVFAPPPLSSGYGAHAALNEEPRSEAIFFFADEWDGQNPADALISAGVEFQVGRVIAAAVYHPRNGCSLH
jgi:hypothetical protein